MEMTGMKPNKTYIIGITGGVGAGKSTVLDYLKEKYDARVILADEVARELLAPGKIANVEIRKIFPKELFCPDGSIKRKDMAEYLFMRPQLVSKQNEIVFPLVKQEIKDRIQRVSEEEGATIIVVEAALLIEEHYDEICDDLWYIDTREEIRRARLKENRGYSDARITNIMNNQLSREEFLKGCGVVIQNNDNEEETFKQVDRQIEKILQ